MRFTSRLRQLALLATSADASNEVRTAVLGPTQNRADAFGSVALALSGTVGFMPTIEMSVNPKSVKFIQTKRINKKDTRQGSVFFHFTNSKGQNNDVLKLQFAGSTGNLDRRGSVGDPSLEATGAQTERTNAATGNSAGQDTGAVLKLLVWHNLYLLTREPMLLADGSENVFSISYSSALFPNPVVFNGFFSQVLEFEEQAEKPNSRQYNFEFTVTSTFPDLDEVLAALGTSMSLPATAEPVPVDIQNAVSNALNTETEIA